MILLIYCFVQLFLTSVAMDQPSTSDYDAYGIRFTANNFLIVKAQNTEQNGSVFAIQFYNLCPDLSCSIELNDSSMYIYSVSIGMNQSIQQQYFAFNGYMEDPNTGAVIAFIGMVQNGMLNSCNFSITYTSISSQYNINEYYVITVDPKGMIAYGFAFRFFVLYNLQTQQKVDWDSGFYDFYYDYSYAPRFMPHAVAATNNYVILVGVISNFSIQRWVPTAYLIDVRNCSISISSTCMQPWSLWPQWTYNLVASSWEMYEADDEYADSNDAYNPLYCLSVDINPTINEILFGIHYFNTVVRLSVDAVNFKQLLYIDKLILGTGVGFGKSVKYTDDGSIVILANNYSLDYQNWYSSSIQFYVSNQNLSDTHVSPVFMFPNIYQPVWSPPMDSNLLAIFMTSVALMFLDINGNVYILHVSPPGYYSDSSSGTGQNQIYFSNTLPCEPGTFKTDTGVDWCRLCPQGSYNSGNMTINCAPCSNTTSFCPLGSVSDTALSFMTRQTQIRAYPESPENIIFDDILILNMFSLNASEQRCLLLSPLFWALIIFGIAISIIILMGLLKLFVQCKPVREVLKKIFRQIDLIGEGEMWMGGLASVAILILCIFAYIFSNSYLNQYPIESVGESSFACDRSLRNAKFSSSLQLLAAVDTSVEGQQKMFDLMNQQVFTLHVLFVNTLFQCNELQVLETYNFVTFSLPFQCSFDSINSVISVNVNLTAQLTTIQFIISSNGTAGGLKIGLFGKEILSDDNKYTVQELAFQEPFAVLNQTLEQLPTIEIQLIKVLNITEPLQTSSDGEEYSCLYIPSFVYDSNQVFYDEDAFDLYHSLSKTTLTLKITNSVYFIKNIQEPIARQAEIIFHNLLFTIVCIEIFGLIFIIFKLILVPLFMFLLQKMATKSNRIKIAEDDVENDDGEMKKRIRAYLRKLEEKDEHYLTTSNTMSNSSIIVSNTSDSPRYPLSIIEQPTNAKKYISVQQPRQWKRSTIISQRSEWE
jgi:hypothetical protein